MTLFFLLALVALAAFALFLWTLRTPRVWPLAMMMIAVMMMPWRASAAALDTFLTAATPGLLELIGLVIAAIIAWGTKKAREKWGIEIEASQREALHWALHTGAQLALKHELTGKAAFDLMIAYAKRSVPDAIGGLKPSVEVLTDLAQAKFEQATTEKVKEVAGANADQLLDALKRTGITSAA